MEVFVERGFSKGDCLQKIHGKYGVWFTVLRERKIPASFFGLVREKVEVEYCLNPKRILAGDQENSRTTAAPSPDSAASAKQGKNDSTLNFTERKKQVLAVAGKDPDQIIQQVQEKEDSELNQKQIMDLLRGIEIKIEAGNKAKQEHPNLIRIAQMLKLNDFSDEYCAKLVEKAHRELPLDTLADFDSVQDHFLEWIGESIKIFGIPEMRGKSRIVVLVGPTGVGKTTTIAKLAANYVIENMNRHEPSVRLINIDAFRVGAKEQIEHYGDIMEIPVSYVDDIRDLRREIDLYREEVDLILVDTIGKSPSDSAKLGEMKKMLEACGTKAEVHLVLSASTKTSDIMYILQQFEPFNYQAVLLSKLDETRHVGNIISALAEKNKQVSYITDGQGVPKDIKKASVVRFLINLDEFRIDRDKFEKRFPAAGGGFGAGADQF